MTDPEILKIMKGTLDQPMDTEIIMTEIPDQYIEAVLELRFEEGWPPVIGIPKEWYRLVFDLHNELIKIDPNYTLLQVKTKFGGLRYYYEHPDRQFLSDDQKEEFRNLVSEAEGKSYEL